jgi:hypothetical protein
MCIAILALVTLGMPYDVFSRDTLIVAAYAMCAVVCVARWRQGPWARVGAVAAGVAAAVRAFLLVAFVMYANGHQALIRLETDTDVDALLGWLEVLAVVGVLLALLMGRAARPSLRRDDGDLWPSPASSA